MNAHVFLAEDEHPHRFPRKSPIQSQPGLSIQSERSPGGPDRDRAHMLYYKESHRAQRFLGFSLSMPYPGGWPGRDRTTYRTDFPGSKMRIARWIPLLLAGFVIAALCRGQEPARPAPIRASPAVPATKFRGSGSCSATACHGSIKRIDGPIPSVRRNEHTTWMSSDLHSRALPGLIQRTLRGHRVQARQTRRSSRESP